MHTYINCLPDVKQELNNTMLNLLYLTTCMDKKTQIPLPFVIDPRQHLIKFSQRKRSSFLAQHTKYTALFHRLDQLVNIEVNKQCLTAESDTVNQCLKD